LGGASHLEAAAAALMAAAALVVLAYRLGSGQPATVAIGAALAVLVVAVSSALRLATGLPRLVGTDRAARLGVLVSGGGVFAAARRVDTVVLAGTSLLTGGGLAVQTVHAVDGVPADEVLRLAGAVARESDRPVDRAIAAATPRLPGVADFDAVDGLGARGIVAEVVGAPGEERVIAHAVLVGDAELIAAHDIDPPAVPVSAGCTPVAVAWDGVARGVLEVGPHVAQATTAALRRLTACRVRVVLVTAEEPAVATAVATRAGLAPDAVLAGVTPRDAAGIVRELGPGVAVIGDSERYEPALRCADLAVRIGWAGTAARPELTLVRGDLAVAVQAIRIVRHTAAVARANLIWSLACGAVLLVGTTAGLLGTVAAAAATAIVAAVLVINGVRPQRGAATHG
jgi:cation transport ATPase